MGVLLCAMVFGLAIGTVIGAVILRAAVSLCNKLTGGTGTPSEVPEPPFGQAALIAFLASLINLGVQFVLGFIVGAGAASGGGGEQAAMAAAQKSALVIQLIGSLFYLLAITGFSCAMLPTTLGKGIVVTLCYLAVALLVGLCIGAIVVISGLAIGGFR